MTTTTQKQLMNDVLGDNGSTMKKILENATGLFSPETTDEKAKDFLQEIAKTIASSSRDPEIRERFKNGLNQDVFNVFSHTINGLRRVVRKSVENANNNIPSTRSQESILDEALSEVNGENKSNVNVIKVTQSNIDDVLKKMFSLEDENKLKDVQVTNKPMSEENQEDALKRVLAHCTTMMQDITNQPIPKTKSSRPSRKVKFNNSRKEEENDTEEEEEWVDVKAGKKSGNKKRKEEESDQEEEEDEESSDNDTDDENKYENEYDNEWSAFHKLVESHQAVVEAYVHLLTKYADRK